MTYSERWTRKHEVVEHSLEVRGAPYLVCSWSRGKPKMSPFRIELVFDRRDAEAWQMRNVKVWGYKVKADGSPGLAQVHETFHNESDMPDWIKDIVDRAEPRDA